MLLLSDCPERLGGLARVEEGSQVDVDSLAPGDRALWQALQGGPRLWRGRAPDSAPPGFWSRAVVVAEAASSQFDALRRALADGLDLPGPTACVALTGRGFHGQRDRPWAAASGNLHLCVVLPEPGLPAGALPSLPTLPVVSLVDAIRSLTGGTLRPGIKWVNDVLIDGRKVGGVLTATQTQGERVSSILLGIGLNVAAAPEVPPTPFVPRVGCLVDAGARVTWDGAAAGVLAALGRRLAELVDDGPGPLLDAYRGASVVIGREVCVLPDSEPGETSLEGRPTAILRGIVAGIAADLSLVVDGIDAPVTRGRLAFAEDCAGLCPL
jgi:BirA family biotin operon repressor/biotin-[acetyl-CoA-carboxylase] ligase